MIPFGHSNSYYCRDTRKLFPPEELSDKKILHMNDKLITSIEEIAKNARFASRTLSSITSAQKNHALEQIAKHLVESHELLIKENEKDLTAAKENGLSEAMIDRLRLTHERIDAMAQGLRQLIELPDPVGKTIEEKKRPNGLTIDKVRTPIGVIGIIYESRPCLLYTSPSPRDLSTSRMPSSA